MRGAKCQMPVCELKRYYSAGGRVPLSQCSVPLTCSRTGSIRMTMAPFCLMFLFVGWCRASQNRLPFPAGVSDAMRCLVVMVRYCRTLNWLVDVVCSGMNEDTKKVNTVNPDEEDVMNALRQHASKTLESDLSDSAEQLGLWQAAYVASRALDCVVVWCVVTFSFVYVQAFAFSSLSLLVVARGI